MIKDFVPGIIIFTSGALLGFLIGSLVTWFPIKLLFCDIYNSPDCEEVVLILFPFYCFVAPLVGGIIAYWLYWKQD
jgi:NhaP-type Na+/H+ or K+/H+ antiporter